MTMHWRAHRRFVVWIVAGLVLRIVVVDGIGSAMDADEAVGILMAKRAATDGQFSFFYWGQNYGGALVSWLEAAMVKVLGFHIVMFRVVSIVAALGNVVLLRSIGRRFLTPGAADAAAVLMWLVPLNAVSYTSHEYLFYNAGVSASLASSLAFLVWLERSDHRQLVLGGAFAGLAFFLLPLMLSLVVPPLLAVCWRVRRRPRQLAAIAGGLCLGAVPWFAAQVVHSFDGLQRHISTTDAAPRLVWKAITVVLPSMLVSGRSPMGWLGVAVLVASVAWCVWFARRRDWAMSIVGATVVIWPFWLAAVRLDLQPVTYRYALVVLPPLALMVGFVVGKLPRHAANGALGLALLAAPLQFGSELADGPGPCPPDLRRTIGYLHQQSVRATYAVYWVAAPLSVCSEDTIRAGEIIPVRDVVAVAEAERSPRTSVVVTTGGPVDLELLRTQADKPPAARTEIGSLTVWIFDGVVARDDLPKATL